MQVVEQATYAEKHALFPYDDLQPPMSNLPVDRAVVKAVASNAPLDTAAFRVADFRFSAFLRDPHPLAEWQTRA